MSRAVGQRKYRPSRAMQLPQNRNEDVPDPGLNLGRPSNSPPPELLKDSLDSPPVKRKGLGRANGLGTSGPSEILR
jgi:hypothetical protein